MPQTDADLTTAQAVLRALQESDDTDWLYDSAGQADDVMYPSIARVLSGAAVLLGGERVVFANARAGEDETSARVVVFSASLLLVWDIDDIRVPGATTWAAVINRSAISSLEVAVAAAPVWTQDSGQSISRAEKWPGMMRVRVRYEGVKGKIELQGFGTDPVREERRTPIRDLVDGLVADLRDRAAPTSE